jgi:hypothetical protein
VSIKDLAHSHIWHQRCLSKVGVDLQRTYTLWDVYSLELFSRKRVWPGLDGPGIMLKVLGSYNIPPQRPNTSHLPSMLQDLCTKLTILEPNEHPKSSDILEMVSELARSTSHKEVWPRTDHHLA